MTRAPRLVLLATLIAVAVTAAPAAAQAPRDARISFETGAYDATRNDWPITAVSVSGDLDGGEPFTVELRDGSGTVLWSGTAPFRPPTTTIDVEGFVAVGDVEEAALAQRRSGGGTPPTTTDPPPTTEPPPTTVPPTDPTDPPDPPDPIDPTDPTAPTDGPAVEGDVVQRPGRTPPGDDPVAPDRDDEDEEEVAVGGTPPGAPPSVDGDVVDRPDQLPQQGNGAGGAGQLALSMVIAVVFVAILFRAPLPAATTVRWRK